MKQYEKPTLIVCLVSQDVITTSKEMGTYDDTAGWMEGWSTVTGGNN